MKKRLFSFILVLVMLISMLPATALKAHAATMTTSEDAIAMIKGFEGFHANAYMDNGQWTIGYGTSSEEGATITEEEADRVMREHVATLETAINTFAASNGLNLNQGKFDALISFSFNCGTAWTKSAGKFRSAVLNGTTGNEFLYAISLWANSGGVPSAGLINRRLAEANLYLNGRCSTTPPSNYTYVLYDANGGTVGEDKMQGFDTNTPAAIKANPTHSNSSLIFAGWYTSKSNGAKVTSLTSANAGKTLYALWGIEVKVTNSYVNVRNAPGTVGTTPIGKLNLGDEVVIFETTSINGALWGRFSGGWISLDYTNYKALMDAQEDKEEEGGTEGGTTAGETVVATAIVKCSTYVNVRNAPSTVGTTIVGKLANGTRVDIYEIRTVQGHKWGRISNGWFCLDYAILSTGSGEDTGDTGSGSGSGTGSGSSETVLRTGTVTHTYVNVRNAPGTAGTTVVGQLNKGDKVNLYEFRTVNGHQWGRIGTNRWVCMDYVTLDAQNSGGSGDDSGSGSGSTATEAIGTVTFPVNTSIYNASGKKIATVTAGTTMTVYGIAEEESTGKLYYIITGGYVEMEGLELVLIAPETYKATRDLPAYGTAGDLNSQMATLNKDAVVSVTKIKLVDGILWCYATADGISAWVDGEYLEETEDSSDSGSGSTGGETGGETGGSQGGNTGNTGDTILRTGYVHYSYVNVRNAPGTVGTKVVDKLNSGARVNLYEFRTVNNHEWGRIGTDRWVCMDYITLDAQNSGSQGGSTGGNQGGGNQGGNTGGSQGGNTGTTGEPSIATGFVNSSTLNIRSGPGLGYGTVGSLQKGNRFNVYEYKLNNNMIWGRIGGAKWICLSYTLLDSTGTVTGGGEMGTIIKTGYAVNIRSGPGTGYALMGKMLINSRVEIFEIKQGNGSNWGRISLGWICMDYVMLDSQLPPGVIPGFGDNPGGSQGGNPGGGTGGESGGSQGGGDQGGNPGGDQGGNQGGNTGRLYTGVVILTNALKIRQTPSTSGAELGTLARNAQVSIYELAVANGMAWGRCDQGWISLTYIDLIPASGNGAVDARVVQYDGLNIREGAGTKYKSVGTYSKGTVVDIFEFSGNWGRTKDGWVNLDYLLT